MGMSMNIYKKIEGNKQLEIVRGFDIIMISNWKEGKQQMNDELKKMVNAIIEEIGRTESKINERFDKVDTRFGKIELKLDSMQHEINA